LGDAKTGTFNLMLPPTNYRGTYGQLLMKRKQVLALFFIDDKIDTGAIILSSEIVKMKMLDMLHDRLMHLGSEPLLKPRVNEKGNVTTIVQTESADIKKPTS
jgi:methionyl-tRNA formyltransferase